MTESSKSAGTMALELRQQAARLTALADILDGARNNGASKKRSRVRRASGLDRRGQRAEQVMAWARERGGEFVGAEAAAALGVTSQGIGPFLAAMARRGELTVRDTDTGRVYAPPVSTV